MGQRGSLRQRSPPPQLQALRAPGGPGGGTLVPGGLGL